MITSYHVHSNFSDGKFSMEEIAKAAVSAGLNELGFSDHYVLLPDGNTVSWSMPPDGLDIYFYGIERVESIIQGPLKIRRGLEVDYFPESAKRVGELLSSYPFDYIIGSVHFFDGFPIDECREKWDAISEKERDEVIKGYWSRIKMLAESQMFDIVGHLDLYKKFGLSPTADVSGEIVSALDAIAKSDMTVELNTSGWHVPAAESYPSAMLIKGCKNRNIPMLITADAHKPADLTRDFTRARDLLTNLGVTETVGYKDRIRSQYNL